MSKPSIQLIEKLSPKSCEQLTKLLTLPPNTLPGLTWLIDQADCIPELAGTLKRGKSVLSRIAQSLPLTTQGATFCKAHTKLNPYLIRRIFIQVSAECTTRTARLVEHSLLPFHIADFVKRLHIVNSLWMSHDLYRVTFQAEPHDARHTRIHSDCEACILAAVGGNRQILSDLRTSMLGRRKKRGPIARLLKLVEAWIEWTGEQDAIRAHSDELAKEVRAVRRQMRATRQQMRNNLAEGIVDDMVTPLLDDGEEHECGNGQTEEEMERDPEGSIIDYYARRFTTTQTINVHLDQSIQPAFRDSLHVPSLRSSTAVNQTPPPRPENPIAYTESKTSTVGHRGASAYPQHDPTSFANRTQGYLPEQRNPRPQPRAQPQVAAPLENRGTKYTESEYSHPGFYAPSTQQNSRVQLPTTKLKKSKSSDEQAGEYRGLLGLEEEEKDGEDWWGEEKPTESQQQKRARPETTWTDFLVEKFPE